jgi:hypothetical protein
LNSLHEAHQLQLTARASEAVNIANSIGEVLFAAGSSAIGLLETAVANEQTAAAVRAAFPTGISYEKYYFAFVFGALHALCMFGPHLNRAQELRVRVVSLCGADASVETLHPWILSQLRSLAQS